VGSGLFNTRGACVTAGGSSGWGVGTGSLGLVCGTGDCCTGGFSSTTSGAGVACASSDALVRLLRCTGCAFESLGSAGLRGFLGFFSGSTVGSFALGFGPGFFRGCPDAVRPRGAGDEVAFPGVVTPPTPTPPVDTRIVEFGVPSGECGGELKLPGEDASLASIVRNTETIQVLRALYTRRMSYTTEEVCIRIPETPTAIRAQVAQAMGYAASCWLRGLQTQHQKLRVASSTIVSRTPKWASS
jgi:hypothetical protein